MTQYLELQARINTAISIEDWNNCIQSIHYVVEGSLTELDSTATLKNTGYFNHTFNPDMIVKWEPTMPAQERFMYITMQPYKKDFWAWQESKKPNSIIFLLAPIERIEELEEHPKGMLVIDAGGLETIAGIKGSTLLRRGQGLINKESAGEIMQMDQNSFLGSNFLFSHAENSP